MEGACICARLPGPGADQRRLLPLPAERSGATPEPGCFTALLVYLPIGVWAYAAASADGVLSAGTLLLSILIGAVAMASAIVMLAIQPRFAYPDASRTPE